MLNDNEDFVSQHDDQGQYNFMARLTPDSIKDTLYSQVTIVDASSNARRRALQTSTSTTNFVSILQVKPLILIPN